MEEYKTSDLYLSAYLRVCDHEIVSMLPGSKCYFIFSKNEKLEQDIRDYYNEKPINIAPLKLFNAVKTMKARTYSA